MTKVFVLLLSLSLLAGCSQISTKQPDQPISQTPAVDSLYQQGLQHKQAGDLTLAQASFERAVRIEPNNAALWFELAQLAYERQYYEEARELALRASTYVGDDGSLKRKINKLLRRVDD